MERYYGETEHSSLTNNLKNVSLCGEAERDAMQLKTSRHSRSSNNVKLLPFA